MTLAGYPSTTFDNNPLRDGEGGLSPSAADEVLLRVSGLQKHFFLSHGVFTKEKQILKAVDGVSLTVSRGETLGLVGESGCGKTTAGRAILRLIEPTAGSMPIVGEDGSLHPEPVRRTGLAFADASVS